VLGFRRCAVNRVFGALFVLLVGSAAGSAQKLTPPKTDTPAPAQLTYFYGLNCPIGLRAQRQGQGNVVIVDGSQRYVPSARVRLLLDNWQSNAIVAMTVTVHGYDAKARVSPMDQGAGDSAELTKTVNLNLSVAGGKKASADVTLHPLATVSRVDLESVEYVDGTRWSASAGKTCGVVPDLLMLVSSN
jgi:hypothetical protein